MCARRERSSSRHHQGDPRRLDESALAVFIQGIHVVFVFTLVGRLLLFAEKQINFYFTISLLEQKYSEAFTKKPLAIRYVRTVDIVLFVSTDT